MSSACTLFRIPNIPARFTRLHALQFKRSISDATDDIQSKHKDDLLSGQFYQLLKSDSAKATISNRLHSEGYTTTTSSFHANSKSAWNPIPILSQATCQTLIQKTIPDLFRGNFDTHIYPDEWHWREGISRDDAAREM